MALNDTELATPVAIDEEEEELLKVEQGSGKQVAARSERLRTAVHNGSEHGVEYRLERRRVNVPLLCLFVFLLEFKPSEPHLTIFLQEKKGLPEDQVNNEVYPVSTYTYLCTLLVSCLLCEFLGYRCMIIAGALCRLCTRALLLFSTELLWLQLAEVRASVKGIWKASQKAYELSAVVLYTFAGYVRYRLRWRSCPLRINIR